MSYFRPSLSSSHFSTQTIICPSPLLISSDKHPQAPRHPSPDCLLSFSFRSSLLSFPLSYPLLFTLSFSPFLFSVLVLFFSAAVYSHWPTFGFPLRHGERKSYCFFSKILQSTNTGIKFKFLTSNTERWRSREEGWRAKCWRERKLMRRGEECRMLAHIVKVSS